MTDQPKIPDDVREAAVELATMLYGNDDSTASKEIIDDACLVFGDFVHVPPESVLEMALIKFACETNQSSITRWAGAAIEQILADYHAPQPQESKT